MSYRIRLICIGKIREEHLRAAAVDFVQRLRPFAALEVVELKSNADYKQDDPGVIRSREAELLTAAVDTAALQIALDERGRQLTSPEFAALINRHLIEAGRPLEFIIGGPWGLSEGFRDSCREVIALSRLTFNHRLARLVLLEQIYRAFQILQGGGYAGK